MRADVLRELHRSNRLFRMPDLFPTGIATTPERKY
jgi:hypothetical protein